MVPPPRWLASVALLAACGGGAEPRPAFTVGAAASLTDVVEGALEEWNAQADSIGRASFASSSTLAKQIEAGAPFDLFLSADEAWVDYLTERGLVVLGSEVELARNRLVLIQNAERRFDLQLPTHRPDSDREPFASKFGNRLWRWRFDEQSAIRFRSRPWSTGDPDHVPLGRYVRATLEAIRWWEDASPTLVPAADARAALRLVEAAEVEWGLVYASDAAASPRVVVAAEVDTDLHPPIVYTGVALERGAAEARGFLEWFTGDAARHFEQHGFPVAAEAHD